MGMVNGQGQQIGIVGAPGQQGSGNHNGQQVQGISLGQMGGMGGMNGLGGMQMGFAMPNQQQGQPNDKANINAQNKPS
jgi:hypothetical protein